MRTQPLFGAPLTDGTTVFRRGRPLALIDEWKTESQSKT